MFERQNTALALLAFFFRRSRYVAMAVDHGMAINLEAPDLLAGFHRGTFPQQGWEAEATSRARESAAEVQQALLGTLIMSVSATVLAFLVLFLAGKIAPDLPFALPKFLGAAGGFLAGWATLFELAGVPRTWSGEALHEKLHPLLFCALFLPGLLLALLGQLW
jgi:hypothetical protein